MEMFGSFLEAIDYFMPPKLLLQAYTISSGKSLNLHMLCSISILSQLIIRK